MSTHAPTAYAVGYDQLCQLPLLQEAWRRVRRGGPTPGVDGASLDRFALQADSHLGQILDQLQKRQYRFLPFRRVFLRKLSGGTRRLAVPTVADRIVAQALRLLLEPLWAASFAPCCFAYRPSLGVHQALDQLLQWIRHGQPWLLETDILDFFDSVSHRLLFRRLSQEPIHPDLLSLLRRAITSGVQVGLRFFPLRKGLPQGSPLSPLLANYFLTPLDHALTQLGHRMIRYADDLVLCAVSRRLARQALDDLQSHLARLRLKLNPQKTRILDSRRESFDFLGFTIHPSGLLPAQQNIDRFRSAIQRTLDPSSDAPLLPRLEYANCLIRSFGHFYARCHVQDLFAQLDQWIAHLHRQLLEKASSSPCQAPALVSLQSILQAASVSNARPSVYFGYAGWRPPPHNPKQSL